jgi:hypothetical protein
MHSTAHQSKKNEREETCSTHAEEKEMRAGFWWVNLREGYH